MASWIMRTSALSNISSNSCSISSNCVAVKPVGILKLVGKESFGLNSKPPEVWVASVGDPLWIGAGGADAPDDNAFA